MKFIKSRVDFVNETYFTPSESSMDWAKSIIVDSAEHDRNAAYIKRVLSEEGDLLPDEMMEMLDIIHTQFIEHEPNTPDSLSDWLKDEIRVFPIQTMDDLESAIRNAHTLWQTIGTEDENEFEDDFEDEEY